MVGLPEHFSGRLHYNGFEFPPAVQARVSMRTVTDSTGRYTKYTAYMLSVEVVIHAEVDRYDPSNPPTFSNPNQIFLADPNDKIDVGMTQLRRLLGQQNRLLIFTSKGYGDDFVVNTQKGDVLYGPRPRLMLWEPLGAAKAVRVIWEVEVTIADCELQTFPWGRIAEYSTDITWEHSDHGLTRRTVTGMVEVVQQFFQAAGGRGRNLSSADSAREVVTPVVPAGFRRVQNRYALSRSRNVANFTYVDEEYESDNPYYQGVVRADVDASIRNRVQLAFNDWVCSVSGTISVSKSHQRWFAWIAFLSILKARLDAGREHATGVDNSSSGTASESSGTEKKIDTNVFVRTVSIREQVNGRGMSFTVTWLLVTSISTVIKASGLWAPNAPTETQAGRPTWEQHQQSMLQAWGPRGSAGMQHEMQMDNIVSLCNTQVPGRPLRDGLFLGRGIAPTRLLTHECGDDYYDVHDFLTVEENPQTARLAPLGGETPKHNKPFKYGVAENYADFAPVPPGSTSEGQSSFVDPVVHTRGTTQVVVTYSGMASRCGKQPVMPRLLKVGGAEVVRQLGKSRYEIITKVKADAGKKPHYRIIWEAQYVLDKPPDGNVYIDLSPDSREFPN